jgi:hypothetical protein
VETCISRVIFHGVPLFVGGCRPYIKVSMRSMVHTVTRVLIDVVWAWVWAWAWVSVRAQVCKAPLCHAPIELLHNTAWDDPTVPAYSVDDGIIVLAVCPRRPCCWRTRSRNVSVCRARSRR